MEEGEVRRRTESFASLFLSTEDTHSSHATTSHSSTEERDSFSSDVPNEYGNTSLDSDTSEYRELQEHTSIQPQPCIASSWEMNYHEAAIFLEEGENNDKFNSHPRDRDALPAYLVTHNNWFYSLDLFAALLLMSLAVIEQPAVFQGVPVGVHASIELFGLFLVGISIVMQLRWLGPRTFLQHKRSVVKSFTWVVMIVDAIIVIVRRKTHFRVTRALRPIFFVDSRYLGGVRRFLRQILQSVPPILEVLGILFFILIIFTTLGFYLFSNNPRDPYFSTFGQGFVSLYVLLTTANYPDVMMPAYAQSHWSAAFFIAFLAINLYFLMNLMLAVVFVVFSDIEKEKFRKLLVHKRRACQFAFRLLVTRSQPTHIPFRHFRGLLKFFRPRTSQRDAYLIFKALNQSQSGLLSLGEFYKVYELCGFKWKPERSPDPWFVRLPTPFRSCCFLIRRLVTIKWFDMFVYCVIVVNAMTLLVNTIIISSQGSSLPADLHVTWDQLLCVSFYGVEAALKIIGLGLMDYLSSGWNIFDLIITILAALGIIAEQFANSFFYVIILRPLRLLRLFRMRKRYRDVFQTLQILLPRISSAIVIIIITYYFFAIIGMEVFSQYDMKNCCVNTTVEQFYRYDDTTFYLDYYYLNNFDNIFIAGVTLFELTIVNNWFIIMEGYVAVTSDWSRLYFMIFYLVMMVVMSVVVAFILEAFTFRMEYNQTTQEDQDEDKEKIRIIVPLTKEELRMIYGTNIDAPPLQQYATTLQTEGVVRYEGVRKRTRVVLQQRMYRDEIPSWLEEADREQPNNPSLLTTPVGPHVVIQQSESATTSSIPAQGAAGNITLPTSTPPSSTPVDHLTSQQTPPSFVGSFNQNGSVNSQKEDT
ncbi:hypothetical protein Pcinc_031021 [Petrolisthes cinctipes]|uniref:Ion transport domain-containing protein n=1 Tax=Petrolisthes cinctipes TaxID=88211 RepID=A0AAE1K550_PETCI|nr:hypothetical protein Pcinc_031021 [Petrolisthes cinctipes]